MKLYTKQGDKGTTSLMNGIKVSKDDVRMELLGTIDELSSHIGLAKAIAGVELRDRLTKVQGELMQIMAKIADARNPKYAMTEEQVLFLESTIDRLENAFPREKKFVLYGGCELSARLDLARTVARRAERRFFQVSKGYNTDPRALQYINRLSDYLYIEARYADYSNRR